MGRNAKPIGLHVAQGNPNGLSKAEIQRRKDSEIKVGTDIKTKSLKCPDYVKADINAFKRWKEIIKIYRDVEFVSSGDTGFLARYCMTYSEYLELLERKERINHISENDDDVRDYILSNELFSIRVQKQLLDMISTDAILRLNTAINRKMGLLINMEDRSFLNPLAKVKNVPQKPKEEKLPSRFGKFGAGKNA